VDRISFDLYKGETLGILGESGCGKSVTALSVMGLLPSPPGTVEGGSIFFKGSDLLSRGQEWLRSLRGKEMAMIFQEPMTSLNPVYTIGDQIGEAFRIHFGLTKRESLDRAAEMLALVGIPSPEKRIHEYPHQLSGGMRQRAMIAMAMACEPALLIADEPTTALDVTIQAQILDLMLELQEKIGMALMMITHDLGVVAEISDRVLVMYAGKIVESGKADAVFARPLHPYTRGLMRSIPQLGRKFSHGKSALAEIPGLVPSLIDPPKGCLFAPRCPGASIRCKNENPPFFMFGKDKGDRQIVRCWLAEKDKWGDVWNQNREEGA
jgi:oligopeptide/dipeptide ABC transporter ATP-binding protein